MVRAPPTTLLMALALVAALFVPAVSAETVTLTFQDFGIQEQELDVFDADGNFLYTVNTSSTISLNSSESARYTLQFKPQPTNLKAEDFADNLFTWLKNNALIMGLILLVLLVIFGRGRK